MTAEQRAKLLNLDIHAREVQQDLFKPAPPVEGGVLKEATSLSTLGNLTAKLTKLQGEVAELKAGQQFIGGGADPQNTPAPPPSIPGTGDGVVEGPEF